MRTFRWVDIEQHFSYGGPMFCKTKLMDFFYGVELSLYCALLVAQVSEKLVLTAAVLD